MEESQINCLASTLACDAVVSPHTALPQHSSLLVAPSLQPPPLLSTSEPPADDVPSHIVPHPRILQLQPSRLLSQTSSLGFLPTLAISLSPSGEFALEGMDHCCLATIKGERGAQISSLAVGGDYLYAGASSSTDSNNSIRIWQRITMRECGGFGSGCGAVKALVVAGDQILSAHQDLKIRVWSRCRSNGSRTKRVAEGDMDLHVIALQEVQVMDSVENSHKLLASMPSVKDYIKSCIPSRNYVQVRRHHKRLWIEHVDNISMLAVGGSAADPLLYSASWDRTIKVWKLSEFKCVESFKAHDDAINALQVAPTGFLYTASADARVKVWQRSGMAGSEAQKHSLVACLDGHESAVNALALSHDGESSHEILYSAGGDRCIVVWEREESAQHMVATGVLRGHQHAILCLVSRESVLCSGSGDHTIRVWCQGRRLERGGLAHSCVAVLHGHKAPVKCLSLACGTEGRLLLYSSSLDCYIKVWELYGSSVKKSEEQDRKEQCATFATCQLSFPLSTEKPF